MANRNIYSVAQVNSYIKNMFAQDFMLRQVSIKGEVSNCKYHTSGHIYFTIKDAGAAMNAIMFAGSRAAGLSFRMKEGGQEHRSMATAMRHCLDFLVIRRLF